MTSWQDHDVFDPQGWIAVGQIVVRVVCSSCGGNKAVVEVRRDGKGVLVLKVTSMARASADLIKHYRTLPRSDMTQSGQAPSARELKESAISEPLCRVHGALRLHDDDLLAAASSATPNKPTTLRVRFGSVGPDG